MINSKEESLKTEICRLWSHDKEKSIAMADQLYQLKKERLAKNSTHINQKQIIELAEKTYDSPELSPDLLNEELSEKIIQYLRERFDILQYQDYQKAISHAKIIIRIGEMRKSKGQIAFGYLTLGGAIMFKGDSLQKAYDYLEHAGTLFIQEGDVIGWARTIICKTAICLELEKIDITITKATIAKEILLYFHELTFFMGLCVNMIKVFNSTGNYQKSIEEFKNILPYSKKITGKGEKTLGTLYNNVGTAYLHKGDFHKAIHFFNKAEENFIKYDRNYSARIALENIAYINRIFGHYNQALKKLNIALNSFNNEISIYSVRVKIDIAECYLSLGKNTEAEKLADNLISEIGKLEDNYLYEFAHGLRCLGIAQSRKNKLSQAKKTLLEAKNIFTTLKIDSWKWVIELMLAEVTYKLEDYTQAYQKSIQTSLFFENNRQQAYFAQALLIKSQCLFALKKYNSAKKTCKIIMAIAEKYGILELSYQTYILLGQIAEKQKKTAIARIKYQKAIKIVESIQKNLTITLRPNFLDDKCEATHRLIKLIISDEQHIHVFNEIERLKTLSLLNYLTNRQRLLWSKDDPVSQKLIHELDQVREEYNSLYNIFYQPAILEEKNIILNKDQLEKKITQYEEKIHEITENLYLHSSIDNNYQMSNTPDILEIQKFIQKDCVLIEFYYYESDLWIFAIEQNDVTLIKSDKSIGDVKNLLDKLYFNIQCALQVTPLTLESKNLLRMNKKIGKNLYNILINPIIPKIKNKRRIYFVPFGILHYLPFNILFNGTSFFIENYELVTLPSAGIISRKSPEKKPGALVLVHTNDDSIIKTKKEAKILEELFPSRVYIEEEATRKKLENKPMQLLHIAAHAQHRTDKPDLSYILLEDGQVYADDFLQQDMKYELVTLSACETGQICVKKSEELIGLIRGILYAGAGAMLLSLWQIDDEKTVFFMKNFYKMLDSGKSKSQAVSSTECEMIRCFPDLHPAYWGAFQLIGNPQPLSHMKEK